MPKFPKSNSPRKSQSAHGSVIRKVPYTNTPLWPVPSPSGSEGNLVLPLGHWIPCSPHVWQSFPLTHHGPPGQKLVQVLFLLLPATTKPWSLPCSPPQLLWSQCHQTVPLSDPLCCGPLLSSRSLPHSSWRFQHQVYCLSLFHFPTWMVHPISWPCHSSTYLQWSFFLSHHFSHQTTVILRPCHLQLYPSVISVPSILLLSFQRMPSYTSAQTILLLH